MGKLRHREGKPHATGTQLQSRGEGIPTRYRLTRVSVPSLLARSQKWIPEQRSTDPPEEGMARSLPC